MIYSDILTKTEQVRDRLVSAINSKGGSLVSNASLNQCADAVTNLPEGGTGGGDEIQGQIFYASFAEDTDRAESGQKLEKYNSPTFVTEDGIKCVKLENSAIYTSFPCFYGDTPFTVSFWGKAPETISNEFHIIWAGENKTYGKVHFEIVDGKFGVSDSLSFFYTENVVTGEFHHFLVTYDGEKLVAYVDGKFATQSGNFTADISLSDMFVGKTVNVIEAGPFFISTLRIFTRVLSADEISMLYDEFVNRDNPSGGGGSSGGGGNSLLQGVAFYSSLTDVETSETADKMNMTGTVSVTSVDGVTSGKFNGSSYLTVETYKKLPQFSICVWLNCATEMSNYGWAIASGEFNFRMEIYNAAIYATAWGANGFNQDPLEGRVSTALTINTWQFIVYSFDSSNYRLHKNASLVSQTEKEKANFTPFFDNICIGGVSNSAYGKFNGNISDAIMYNRALTDEEIAELYALGPGGFEKIWFTKKSNEGTLFFTTTEKRGKPDSGYMFAGIGTLKLQLATGEITELSLTDKNQRAFSAYELSNVRIVSGGNLIDTISIGGIGVNFIDFSVCPSVKKINCSVTSSIEIKNLSQCHFLNDLDFMSCHLSTKQIDQLLLDVLTAQSHLYQENFSGSLSILLNSPPSSKGLEIIKQLQDVGWSVNYDRSIVYTDPLNIRISGTPVGDIEAVLNCVDPSVILQDDVSWNGRKHNMGGADSMYTIQKENGKWKFSGDYNSGITAGESGISFSCNFETSDQFPWDATWENTKDDGMTLQVFK